jgi:hypothetical protein
MLKMGKRIIQIFRHFLIVSVSSKSLLLGIAIGASSNTTFIV